MCSQARSFFDPERYPERQREFPRRRHTGEQRRGDSSDQATHHAEVSPTLKFCPVCFACFYLVHMPRIDILLISCAHHRLCSQRIDLELESAPRRSSRRRVPIPPPVLAPSPKRRRHILQRRQTHTESDSLQVPLPPTPPTPPTPTDLASHMSNLCLRAQQNPGEIKTLATLKAKLPTEFFGQTYNAKPPFLHSTDERWSELNQVAINSGIQLVNRTINMKCELPNIRIFAYEGIAYCRQEFIWSTEHRRKTDVWRWVRCLFWACQLTCSDRYQRDMENEPDATILKASIADIWENLNREWQQSCKVLVYNNDCPIVRCEGLQETDNKCIFSHGFFKGSKWSKSCQMDHDLDIINHTSELIQMMNSCVFQLRASLALVTSEILSKHILSTPQLRTKFYDTMFCLYLRCAYCHCLKRHFRKPN